MAEAISVQPLKYTDRVVRELEKKIEETKLTQNIWPIVGWMGVALVGVFVPILAIPPGTHIAAFLPSFIPETALLALPALIPATGIIAAIQLKLENRKYRKELKAVVADRATIGTANLAANRIAQRKKLGSSLLVEPELDDRAGGASASVKPATQRVVRPAKKTAETPTKPVRRRGGPKGPALDKT
jgi:hypothetical protein